MDRFLAYLAIGISDGFIYAMLTLGIVLVYKGSRVLNFAHPYFGLVCAFITWWLTDKASFFPFTLMPFQAGSVPRFLVAALLGLLFIARYGRDVEHFVMRPLKNAPRLVQLVATIALAQGAVGLVALLFNRTEDQANTFRHLPLVLPKSTQFEIGSGLVTAGEIQVLIVAPVISLAAALFFTRTRYGVAIRAAAENSDAARLLGISAARVSTFVWVTGAVLAGLAGIMITQKSGSLDIATLSTGFLVRGLAAALVGGLTSLPGAFVGGILVGVGEAMARLATDNRPGAAETLLFIVIIGFLIFRPNGLFGQRDETEDKVAFVPALKDLPARLRNSPVARTVRVIGLTLCGLLSLISLTAGSEVNGILVRVIVYAIVAVSLTVLMGFSGQISLGHWGLTGVGAFALANMIAEDRLNWPFLVALPLTFVVGMVVALLIGLPALRIKGLYLAVATLAFNLAAEYFIFRSELVGNGTAGIIVAPPKVGPFDLDSPTNRPLFFFSVLVLAVCLVLARNLARSRTGRGFYALRENEKAAATLGVGLTKYRLLAFAVSGGIASLGGAVFCLLLDGSDYVPWVTAESLVLVSVVMIGGIGSLSGSVLGAFLVIGMPDLVKFENPWIVPIGTGILLITVLLRAPGGLAGLLQLIRGKVVGAFDEMATAAPPPAVPPAKT